jgi:glycosyltransferase involved in cell wall biosynthesis
MARPTMSPGFPCFADGYSNPVTPSATPSVSPAPSPLVTPNTSPDPSRRGSYTNLADSHPPPADQPTSRAEAAAAALARAAAALAADLPPPPPALAAASSADVLFAPNLPHAYRLRLLGAASLGIHAAPDEPFSTSVVELMAAGVPPVAHKSGGPLYDLVGPSGKVGLLATSPDEYAAAMSELLLHVGGPARRRRMAGRARRSAVRDLSEDEFARRFCRALRPLLEGA